MVCVLFGFRIRVFVLLIESVALRPLNLFRFSHGKGSGALNFMDIEYTCWSGCLRILDDLGLYVMLIG
jgi:hypothetical protein